MLNLILMALRKKEMNGPNRIKWLGRSGQRSKLKKLIKMNARGFLTITIVLWGRGKSKQRVINQVSTLIRRYYSI